MDGYRNHFILCGNPEQVLYLGKREVGWYRRTKIEEGQLRLHFFDKASRSHTIFYLPNLYIHIYYR